MAYLKGGSVVDGNLYVEGGLRVKRITDSSGKALPHLFDSDSSLRNHLVKFMDSDGAIHHSLVSETIEAGNIPVYSIINTLNNQKINKVLFYLNNNSVATVEVEKDGLFITLDSYENGKSEKKQFKLEINSFIIPYSANKVWLSDSIDSMVGVDSEGYECMPEEAPEEFVYDISLEKRVFPFKLTRGNSGIKDIYYKVNNSTLWNIKSGELNVDTACRYINEFQWYATAKDGYVYSGEKKTGSTEYWGYDEAHPYIGKMSEEGFLRLLEAEKAEFSVELSKGEGISKIFYKVNSATKYTESSESVNTSCLNGKQFSWYAEADSDHYFIEYTENSPYTTGPDGIKENYEHLVQAKSNKIPIRIEKGLGLTKVSYLLEGATDWVESEASITSITGIFGTTFKWKANPHEGYSYDTSEHSFVIGETVDPILTGDATLNKYSFKVTKPSTIKSLTYRVNDSTEYATVTSNIEDECYYDKEYSWYATPNSGYKYDYSSASTSVTGKMAASDYLFEIKSEDVTPIDYPFTIIKNNSIQKIFYKVNNATDWTESEESVGVTCKYNQNYAWYALPATGYSYTPSTPSEATKGKMTLNGKQWEISGTPITYSISKDSSYVELTKNSYTFNPSEDQTLEATYTREGYTCSKWEVTEGCTLSVSKGGKTTITIPAEFYGDISVVVTESKILTATVTNPNNNMVFYELKGDLFVDKECSQKVLKNTSYSNTDFYYIENDEPIGKYIYDYGDGPQDADYVANTPSTQLFLRERWEDKSLQESLFPYEDEGRNCWSTEQDAESGIRYWFINIRSGEPGYYSSSTQKDGSGRENHRLGAGDLFPPESEEVTE